MEHGPKWGDACAAAGARVADAIARKQLLRPRTAAGADTPQQRGSDEHTAAAGRGLSSRREYDNRLCRRQPIHPAGARMIQ